MTGRYVFYLGLSPDENIRWAKLDAGAPAEFGEIANVEALADFRAGRDELDRAAVIFPGEQAAFRMMPAPPRSGSKFRAAARYLLEDELGEAVDGVHIVTAIKDGKGLILAAKHAVLDDWLETFNAAGVELDAAAPDFLCLPDHDGAPVVLFDGDRVVAALDGKGFAAERHLADSLLTPAAQAGALDGAALYDAPNDFDVGQAQRRRLDAGGATGLLARAIESGIGVDLLQGKRRVRPVWRRNFAEWRRPALLAAALAFVWLAVFIAGGARDLRLAKAYAARATALHAEAFPDDAGAEPYAHAREVLAAGGGASLLGLSATVAEALEDVDGVQIDRLRYNQARDQIVISLRSTDDRTIETFRQRLAEAQVAVSDAGGYRRADNEWIGDMIVGRP